MPRHHTGQVSGGGVERCVAEIENRCLHFQLLRNKNSYDIYTIGPRLSQRKSREIVMLTGNALIGQSGGPTAVINASLVGVVEAVKRSKAIGKAYGMRFGIEGVLGDFLLNLSIEPTAALRRLRNAPS